MGKAMRSALLCAVLFYFGFLMPACVSKNSQTTRPVLPPVDLSEQLAPGLPVYFRYSFYRHINQMPSDDSMISEGTAGAPVKNIDFPFPGDILDSGKDMGVGVLMKGYLKIKTPGTYRFKAMSNDGIRVTLNGKNIVYDPSVHSDRFSAVGEMSFDTPSWYPIVVKYYQRKGGARLELHWQPPGLDEFDIVPAEMFGHK